VTGTPPTSRSSARLFWGVAVSVIIVDLITKLLAEQYLPPRYVPHRIVGDVVRFTLAYNPGAAFSMSLGDHSRIAFGLFAVIALGVLWHLYRTTNAGDTIRALALGLAFGGAAGNLLDRVRSASGVVDFIDIGVGDVRFWTFNVADSAVTVGAILLGWVFLQQDRAAQRMTAAGDAR